MTLDATRSYSPEMPIRPDRPLGLAPGSVSDHRELTGVTRVDRLGPDALLTGRV